jgi:hypothetical protein
MSRTLLRSCLGCGTSVRGHPRCRDCQAKRDQAKAARRPDLKRAAQTRRRREAVADHRATIGDWCPGWERHGAHPSADLTADHVTEVAAGGPRGWPAGRALPLLQRCPLGQRDQAPVRRRGSPHGVSYDDPAPAELSDTVRGDRNSFT